MQWRGGFVKNGQYKSLEKLGRGGVGVVYKLVKGLKGRRSHRLSHKIPFPFSPFSANSHGTSKQFGSNRGG
jgi:hypothetical protein